jgi:hypothetical protein
MVLINIFYLFVSFMASIRELICHTVCYELGHSAFALLLRLDSIQ